MSQLMEQEGNVIIEEEGNIFQIKVLKNQKGKIKLKIESEVKLNVQVEKEGYLELTLESNCKEQTDVENEMVLEEDAKLIIKEIHLGNLNVKNKLVCKKRSIVTRQVANLSNGELNVVLNCSLDGEGADFSDEEVHFGIQNAKVENRITVDHHASNTKSLIRIKGACKDMSKNKTYGMIRVDKDTENANTFLSAHMLLLGKDAEALAIPALEIESAEVQAGHSASVSTVDEDQVFYLTTRGLSEEEAKKEIVKGFLVDLVCEQRIAELIEAQW